MTKKVEYYSKEKAHHKGKKEKAPLLNIHLYQQQLKGITRKKQQKFKVVGTWGFGKHLLGAYMGLSSLCCSSRLLQQYEVEVAGQQEGFLWNVVLSSKSRSGNLGARGQGSIIGVIGTPPLSLMAKAPEI